MDFTLYSANIMSILDDIMRILNLTSNKYVQISNTYSGSTVIEGYIAPPLDGSGNVNSTQYASVSQSLIAGSSIGGFAIIQSSISISNGDSPLSLSDDISDQNKIIIIAVVCSVVGLTIIIVAAYLFKKYYLTPSVKTNAI
jgi:hypothetical protein